MFSRDDRAIRIHRARNRVEIGLTLIGWQAIGTRPKGQPRAAPVGPGAGRIRADLRSGPASQRCCRGNGWSLPRRRYTDIVAPVGKVKVSAAPGHTSSELVRTLVAVERGQHDWLRRRAFELRTSIASEVRNLIQSAMDDEPGSNPEVSEAH